MKGFIKIGLIALAAIIVGILIFVFIGVIDTLPPTTIAPKDFTATVENRIRQEITGKPFSEARTAFDNLNGFIATESFATLTTGEKDPLEMKVAKTMKLDNYEYPLVVVVDKDGTILMHNTGYNIGLADLILKVL